MPDKAPKGRKRKAAKPKPKAADAPKPEAADIADLAEAAAGAAAEPPPSGDAPPGSTAHPDEGAGADRPRRRSRISKKETQAIEDALRELLQMPAVPAALFGDEWAARHFTTQGDVFAQKIAAVSERNPVLRRWCLRAMEGESIAVLFVASLLYAGPPLLHFGLMPGGELLGIPVLKRRQPVPAQHTEPESSTYGREEPEPYGTAPPTTPPPPTDDADAVVPDSHFADDGYDLDGEQSVIWEGGVNGEGPPLWQRQMLG